VLIRRRVLAFRIAGSEQPFLQVSLVIPVRNEEKSIRALVESIKLQTFQPFEVIIVDGGSQDRTVAFARAAIGDDRRFKIIEAGPATPGRGRNIGARAARCDWLAFTDAGIELEPTWLAELVRAVRLNPDLDVVYGNYEPVTDSFFKSCAALAYVPPKHLSKEGLVRGPSIASCLIRRSIWAETGGFPDLRAAEDLIFMERIERNGARIGWAPRATVWWQLQPSFRKTFKKFALYSFHNVLAGRQRYWHYGIARQYLIGSVVLLLAFFHHAWWLSLLFLGILTRVARSIWRHRKEISIIGAFNPKRFLCVAAIILTIDLATFVGWGRAVVYRLSNGKRKGERVAVR